MSATATDESVMKGRSLNSLLEGVTHVNGIKDVRIDHMTLDSRQVGSGGLFFAVPGTVDDGRKHISTAIESGASAIVYESSDWLLFRDCQIPCIGISGLRSHIGHVADKFYGEPSSELHVIGITGTNGKSTCATLTAQALESLGKKCAVVGTLGSGFHDDLKGQSLTTPDAVSLHESFASFVESGAQFASLEVSSHALDQSRTSGIRFETVVFTNLSSDHMDYHKTHPHYRNAKAKLFEDTHAANAVLNIDDDFGRSMVYRTQADNVFTYGNSPSDVRLIQCSLHRTGMNLAIQIEGANMEVQSAFLGLFNGLNITAVAAVLHTLEIPPGDIETALNELKPVSGRMERIEGGFDHPDVVIDYAHTPHGLQCALASVRQMKYKNITCVFGCGGDRDAEKRPLMGFTAENLASRVILTNDNPRDEDPTAITDAIAAGMRGNPRVIHDRREAIHAAIRESCSEDVVLVAGKGHEQYQICGTQKLEFKDRAVVCEILGSGE